MPRLVLRGRALQRRRGLFVALFSLLVAGLVTPAVVVEAAEVTDGLVAWYKLDAASGTTVVDASGNKRDATVRGTAQFGGDEGLAFNGTDTHLKLPDHLLAGMDSISVATDVYVDRAQAGSYFIYGFGNTDASTGGGKGYLFTTGDKLRTSISLTNRAGEKTTSPDRNLARGVWKHVVYTQTGTTGVLYEDGVKVATNTAVTVKPSDIGTTSTANYIGKSLYRNDPLFKGRMRDFRVFNRALSASEAARLTDEWRSRAVALDKALLSLGDTSKVTTSLALPSAGRNGSTITWSSSNTAVLANDGTITQPAKGSPDATVTLTATLARGDQEDTKAFKVTVLADQTDDSVRVNLAKEQLIVHNVDDVRGNLTLPAKGAYDTTITWKSDRPSVISADGVVNRPRPGAEKISVNLIATLRLNQVESSRTFTATVPPLSKPQALKGYLFSYFTGEHTADGEQVYFGLSKGNDPLRWRELNGGKPVLRSTLGEQGLRDPFIIRSPEGDKFYQIATDLKINGNGNWDRSQRQGSKSIMVWESTDLVTWTNQRLVRVSPDTAGNTWAPEAFYDPSIGAYVVYWASMIYAADDPGHTGGTYNKMMYATTRDFYTFSEPKVWNDPGHSIIDSTMIKHDDRYYRFTKDEAGDPACAGVKYVIAEWSDAITGSPYHEIKRCIGQTGMTKDGEGPLVFKSNTEDKWYMFVDEYSGKGYTPFETTDLEQKTDSWKPSKNYTMPSSGPRHGTVLPVTKAEYTRLLKAYGSNKTVATADGVAVATVAGRAPALPVSVPARYADGSTGTEQVDWEAVPESAYATAGEFTVRGTLTDEPAIAVQAKVKVRPQADLLVQYKFDETGGKVARDSSGLGHDGTYERTPAFGTGVQGGSFRLAGGAKDSTTAPYVTIPNGVLGGVDSVTVSAYVKADSTAANRWVFGLGPDDQRYLFATPANEGSKAKAGITTGSWQTESQAIAGAALPTKQWKHVAVVLDAAAKTLVLYIDGVEAGRVTDVPIKASDLYDPIKGYAGYLGRSRYADDGYFAGELDDFRIHGRALSPAEVLALGGDTTAVLEVDEDDLRMGPTPGGTSTGGGLPVTGVQLALYAGVGAVLVAAGVPLYLIGRRRRTAGGPGESL